MVRDLKAQGCRINIPCGLIDRLTVTISSSVAIGFDFVAVVAVSGIYVSVSM